MSSGIYRKLQKQLDQYAVGFPATESGVELRILQKLFSEEDAEVFLQMTLKPDTAENIARRLNRDPDAVAVHLEKMYERGLIFRVKEGQEVKYGASGFLPGIWEFQLPTLDRELAELIEEYDKAGFLNAKIEGADLFMRTIPVNQAVEVAHHVATYEDAREILRKAKKIALTECICRKEQKLMGRGCEKDLEVCFMFGHTAQYYLDRGMAREIDLEEAFRVLARAQDAGLVTQPSASQNPSGLCNCCGDCCVVLRALNKHAKPAEKVYSSYFAVVDEELCTGCEACLDRCQMSAIRMKDEQLAVINTDRCIGCGLCVTTCPSGALRLESKPEDQCRKPPATGRDQASLLAQRRGTSLTPLFLEE